MALVNDYELIISDIDGVVVREGEPIWENIKALRQLKDKGISIIFVTNNSGFSRVLLSRQLSYLGLNVTPNEIVTSGLAAAIYMKEKLKNIKRVFPVGE
ncbi:HAD family hydrolase, partial [Sulfolobus sp. A20-N-G8]